MADIDSDLETDMFRFRSIAQEFLQDAAGVASAGDVTVRRSSFTLLLHRR